MTCLVLLTFSVNASGVDHYAGEAYLQTVEEISSWTVRNGIVKTGLPWFDQLAQQYSISVLRTVDISCQIGLFFYHIDFDNGNTVDDVCDEFNQKAEVIQAWPLMIPEWYATPDDQYYGNQWGMTQIDAPSAWDYETGNSSVLIGILDTGADVYDSENQQATVHPDLLGNLWNDNGLYGLNVIEPGEFPDDGFGHGTHVAGITGAVTNNQIGVSGVAGGGFGNGNGVNLLVVRNGNDLGLSTEEFMAESICQALNPDGNWSTNDWVDIINMSWGMNRGILDTVPSCDEAFPILRLAISEAANRGVVLIAATGNHANDFSSIPCEFWPYPAGYDEVIAVAATNPDDDHVDYSTRGPFVEVAAPSGVGFEITNVASGHGIEFDSDDIFSTFPRDPFTLQDPNFWSAATGFNIVETNISNNYGYSSGTSMAAPYVSGLAGLILSRFPVYSATDVRDLLKNSAEKVGLNFYDGNGWNKYLGYGRINVGYAIAPPATPQNFTVTGNIGDHPTSSWSPNTEPDFGGYYLYKNEAGTGWVLFRTLDENTTSYTDNSVIIGSGGKFSDNVCYKVSAFDISDQESPQSWPRCKPLGSLKKEMANLNLIPENYNLDQAFPNPFNPITTIKFDIPEYSNVKLTVFDLSGRMVIKLVNQNITAGTHQTVWNGKDKNGRAVSSGVYLYTLTAKSKESGEMFTHSNKMVLLK